MRKNYEFVVVSHRYTIFEQIIINYLKLYISICYRIIYLRVIINRKSKMKTF